MKRKTVSQWDAAKSILSAGGEKGALSLKEKSEFSCINLAYLHEKKKKGEEKKKR